VLVIFLVLCINCGLSYTVKTEKDGTQTCQYPPNPYARSMPTFMLCAYFTYTFFYYCCTCCANKVIIEKAEVDEADVGLE